MAQINTALELEKEAATFGYLDFFRTPGNRKRLFIIVYVGAVTQLLGNGIIVRALFNLFRPRCHSFPPLLISSITLLPPQLTHSRP